MDESRYLALREKLQERADRESKDQDFLIRFIEAVEHRVNQAAGREREVCTAGSMTGTEFVKHQYGVHRSTVEFTLQIDFHLSKKVVTFVHIHFTAECYESSFIVRCLDTSEKVEQPREAAQTEAGQLAVAHLLDLALEKAVNKALNA